MAITGSPQVNLHGIVDLLVVFCNWVTWLPLVTDTLAWVLRIARAARVVVMRCSDARCSLGARCRRAGRLR